MAAKDLWASRNHVGAARPLLLVKVRRGRFFRGNDPWTGDDVDATEGTADPENPWQATWTPGYYSSYDPENPGANWVDDDDYTDLPNVLKVETNKSFETKGIDVATIQVENIVSVLHTEAADDWHEFMRGYLAPLRGYVGSGMDALTTELFEDDIDTNEWFRILDGPTQVTIWENYGPTFLASAPPIFTGLVDDVDTTSRPDVVTVTARSFGQILSDSRVFGWNKEVSIPDPVIFIDKDDADSIHKVGYDAEASSERDGHPASLVRDGDGDTAWLSENQDDTDHTEWVEIRLPEGRYNDYILHPWYDGMQIYVSLYAHDREAGPPLKNGDEIDSGWVQSGGGGEFTNDYEPEETLPVAIPDYPYPDPAVGEDITFEVTEHGSISNVSLSFYVTHTWISDCVFVLTHPNGLTKVVVANGVDDDGDDFGTSAAPEDRTTIDDSGALNLEDGTPPFVGTFKPSYYGGTPDELGGLAMADFNGLDAFGTWTLNLGDYATGDTGDLHAATLTITGDADVPLVPGDNGGIPYIVNVPGVSDSSAVRTLLDDYTVGADSILRISFVDLASVGGGDYRAGVRTLAGRRRTLSEEEGADNWVRTSDISDMVKVVLRWAGFKEWEVESTGVSLPKRMLFNRGSFYMDVIDAANEIVSYAFFIKDPTDDDLSIGVPVFRRPAALRDPTPIATITDRDLLTAISVKESDESLPYIIRVRGREAPHGGHILGGDKSKRVMYTFRPPFNFRLAGILKHVIMTRDALSSEGLCRYACYGIALEAALESVKAAIEIPGYPRDMDGDEPLGLDLDEAVILEDLGTGLTTRLALVERTSTFECGEQAKWTMTAGGALLDTPDVEAMVAIIEESVIG